MAEKGCRCPCCGQHAKMYRRPLNATMARGLVWLVCEAPRDEGGWVQVRQDGPKWLLQAGGEFAKLAHWGLIEEQPKDPDCRAKGRTSGVWRPTSLGRAFVLAGALVPRKVWLYDNAVQGFSAELVSVQEALGEDFDLGEVLSASGYPTRTWG